MGRQSKTVQFPVESVKSGENSIGGDFGDCERGNTTTPEGEEAQNHHSTYVLNVKRMGRRNRIKVGLGRCTSPNEVGHNIEGVEKATCVSSVSPCGHGMPCPYVSRIHDFSPGLRRKATF